MELEREKESINVGRTRICNVDLFAEASLIHREWMDGFSFMIDK